MIIKEYKLLIGLQHIHMEQMLCEREMLMIKDLFFEMVLQQQKI